MRCWFHIAFPAVSLIAGAAPLFAAGEPYKDTSLPFDKRVADLVGRLTLQEKAEQIQWRVPADARLAIPACCWWSEGIHGISRAGVATIFPQSIGMAATWDPELLHQIGNATSDEARAKFDTNGSQYRGIILWAPTINMARDPRWGRTEETYGEDPFLTSRLAVNFVQGLQGDDPKYLKTVATPKHFAMHNQETNRIGGMFTAPESLLRDYYFPAFQACFQEGKAASVMAAHNGLNGVPCHANDWLLTDVLRNQWGFQGAVVTDWQAIRYLSDNYGYGGDAEAASAAISAGIDVISDPRVPAMINAVIEGIRSGQLKQEALDRAASRDLLVRFRLGMFDPPAMVPFTRTTPASSVGSKEHIAVARKAAEESFVLLKNDPAPKGFGFDKLLPLDLRRIDSIAVLGPYANQIYFGAYSAQSPSGPCPSITQALQTSFGDRVKIRTADWNNRDASIQTAEDSTLAIVALGLNIEIEKEGIDRSSLQLPPAQQAFLERIVKANPLTIVLLVGGSPIATSWIKDNVPAALMLWYPGQEYGNAVARTLTGEANPSGRLPITFYRATDDLPPMTDYDITRGRTYMYLQKPAPYSFGHGLSYTSFDYANLKLSSPPSATLSAKDTLTASLDITNSGKYDGDEVVQLYIHEQQSAVKRPLKQLKAFQRISLPKGQTKPVTFTLPIANLCFWNTPAKSYKVDPGRYDLLIGASSSDIRAQSTFTIK